MVVQTTLVLHIFSSANDILPGWYRDIFACIDKLCKISSRGKRREDIRNIHWRLKIMLANILHLMITLYIPVPAMISSTSSKISYSPLSFTCNVTIMPTMSAPWCLFWLEDILIAYKARLISYRSTCNHREIFKIWMTLFLLHWYMACGKWARYGVNGCARTSIISRRSCSVPTGVPGTRLGCGTP